MNLAHAKIAVIGLGYVGLPLAVEFGKRRPVLAVGHREFCELGAEGVRALGAPGAVLYDVKSMLPLGASDGRL